jgi:FkbM family methyltransferase
MRFRTTKRLGLWLISKGINLPEAAARYQEEFYLMRLLRRLSINCVIDVGANIGQFARELRAAGYDGVIYSFEPVTRTFAELQAGFGRDRRWRGFQFALGSKNTSMTINVIPSLTELSSLLTPREDWNIEQETIAVRRLDEIFADLVGPISDPRVFLKMDTQGYDLQVFAGASGCIDRIAALQSELSVVPLYDGMPTYLEALSTFDHAGFKLTNVSPVTRAPTGELVEVNCTMTRDERAPARSD